jgi:hypothetical protein
MRKTGFRRAAAAAAGLCLAAALAVPQGLAQDGPGGLRLSLGISGSLRADSNPDLAFAGGRSERSFVTRLSFGLTSETRTQALRASLSSGYRLASGARSRFEDPRASLSYTREGVNSRLALSASYRETRLRFFEALLPDPEEPPPDPDTPPDPDDLVSLVGTRASYDASLTWETGLRARLGALLELRHRGRDFTGTLDPALFDSRTDTAAVTLRFDLAPATVARLRLARDHYRAADAPDTDRTTDTLRLSLSHAFSEALRLEASIGRSRIETEAGLGPARATTETRGTTAGLTLARDLANGSVALAWTHSFGVTGRRDTLRVSRSLALPAGSLEASLGATRGAAGRTEAVGRLAWRQDLPRGTIAASVERSVATNSLDQDVLTTRASASWNRELNAVSSLTLGLTYARNEDAGAGVVAARERTSLRAAWNRTLIEDVQLSAGIEHRRRTEAGGSASSNAVFVTLSRRFDLRP